MFVRFFMYHTIHTYNFFRVAFNNEIIMLKCDAIQVLDLMVRMLGFSDEDKRRIGLAQQASGKTAVRGVLGLPGRLVGGILGGRSSEVSPDMQSETQVFFDFFHILLV